MQERRRRWALARALLAVSLLFAAAPAAIAADAGPGLEGVVNVNTATAEELQLLPGIGPAKARAILEARRSRGGFEEVDELAEVKGIGEIVVERLRPHATVTGKTTAQRP
jgi:competence protein ComEA